MSQFYRNFFLKGNIKVKIEVKMGVTGRRGRRGKRLETNLKETRRYWKLKDETLGRTLLRSRPGRDYIPLIRQTIFWCHCTWFENALLVALYKLMCEDDKHFRYFTISMSPDA